MFQKIDGYKTYALAMLGVLVSAAGYLWGPVHVGPVNIPQVSPDDFARALWACLSLAALRHGVSTSVKVLLLGVFLLGGTPCFADAPSLEFFKDAAGVPAAGIQIPGMDDWRQVNRYDFNQGNVFAGFEGAWAHLWWFESFVGGVATPTENASPLLNAYATADFDLIDFLHEYGIVSDKLAGDVSLSGYGGYKFVNASPIYGVAFKFKL